MAHRPETQALHAGYRSDPTTGAVAVPIYQTTSYQFRDTQHASDLFALAELGNIYTRIMNPTTDVLEQRLAAMEGGAAALAVASGQAASLYSVQNLSQSGDNFVCSTHIYGGTWNLFNVTARDMGIEVRFVDPTDPEAFRKASDDRTRAYYGETLPNPKLEMFPIAEVAAIGRELGIPLIMDNTSAPILCRPFDHGAAVTMYSTTKYLGGHGTSIGGILIDGGNFDWETHKDRFPVLTRPDPGIPRRGVARSRQTARTDRLRAQGPSDTAARRWRLHVAVQCVPVPAGNRNRGAAHAEALGERHGGGHVTSPSTRRSPR